MASKRRGAVEAESSEEEEDLEQEEEAFGVEDVEPDSDDYNSGSEGASSSADESEEEFSSDEEEDKDDEDSDGEGGARGGGGNESDYSSSEDERMVNTVGNVPMEWYEHEEHIGYDREGKKIMRKTTKQDRIDSWLSGNDDKAGWRTVYDEVNDEKVKLTPKEVDILTRLADGKFPHSDFDQYAPMMRMKKHVAGGIHPLINPTEPKARFVPSKWEAKAVVKIVRAMRRGDIKPPETEAEKEAKERQGYLLWGDDDRADDPENLSKAARARKLMQVSAPKVAPPGHAESYNPPAEYLPSEEELLAWKDMAPEDRPHNFDPTQFGSMRQIPAYGRFVNERFERCLDLYLCPRTKRTRLNIDPESLVPKLPKPSELRPFPTEISVVFKGHDARIRSISVDPSGQWLASGSDDKTVRLWEAETGRQVASWLLEDVVECVAFNPCSVRSLALMPCTRALLFLRGPALLCDGAMPALTGALRCVATGFPAARGRGGHAGWVADPRQGRRQRAGSGAHPCGGAALCRERKGARWREGTRGHLGVGSEKRVEQGGGTGDCMQR